MIRDALMEKVVRREQEPITPFLNRIRPLYEEAGISVILVAGSSGLFFEKADLVIQMDNYLPFDITERAKDAAREAAAGGAAADGTAADHTAVRETLPPLPDFHRCPKGERQRDGERRRKIKVTGIDEFLLDRESVRLGQVEQLADREQTAALGYALLYLEEKVFDGRTTLREAVEKLRELLEKEGLEALSGGGRTVPSLAMPRVQEIFACVSRYRGLRF